MAVILGDGVLLMEVDQFEIEAFAIGRILRVPVSERHGSWSRRPWAEDSPNPVQAPWNDLLCLVHLGADSCLDGASLRRLNDMGCPVN